MRHGGERARSPRSTRPWTTPPRHQGGPAADRNAVHARRTIRWAARPPIIGDSRCNHPRSRSEQHQRHDRRRVDDGEHGVDRGAATLIVPTAKPSARGRQGRSSGGALHLDSGSASAAKAPKGGDEGDHGTRQDRPHGCEDPLSVALLDPSLPVSIRSSGRCSIRGHSQPVSARIPCR
jgi:hypothetical protein